MLPLRNTAFRELLSLFVARAEFSATVKKIHSHSPRQFQPTMHLRDGETLQATNGTSTYRAASTDTMPYTNCETRIIDLSPLKLPQDPKTPDSKLCDIYRDYVNSYGSHNSSNEPATQRPKRSSKTHATSNSAETAKIQQADSLVAAILSLKTGIAPPVAFPTETVYGLGADATNPASIAGIFAAKGRPSDNPLIVHVSSTEHLERCLGGTEGQSAIPEVYKDLVNEFWPGPLTILIPVPQDGKGVKFAANVHPGQSTIGFRIPSSPYARFLLAVTDRPIAAPSANSSGKPSPTTAQHVKDDLDGKINFILDGGSCDVGVESTVVDGLGEVPLILRPGGVSKFALRNWGRRRGNVWQHVENGWESPKTGIKRKRTSLQQDNGSPQSNAQKVVKGCNGAINGTVDESIFQNQEQPELDEDTEDIAAPRAPGMKYKHYAPKARMFLFEPSIPGTSPDIQAVHTKLKELLAGRNVTSNDQINRSLKTLDTPIDDVGKSQGSTHTLSIGLLPSTLWTHLDNYIENALMKGLHPDWRIDGPGHRDVHGTRDVHMSTSLNASRQKDRSTAKQVRLEKVDLGEDSATISRNLFAALRTCDDLECDWIFAEAPSRSAIKHESNGDGAEISTTADEDEFETVLERLRKAATEIVYC